MTVLKNLLWHYFKNGMAMYPGTENEDIVGTLNMLIINLKWHYKPLTIKVMAKLKIICIFCNTYVLNIVTKISSIK